MNPPDFDQIALDIVEELLDAVGHDFIRPDGQSKAQSQIAVAKQLRNVWNARCAIAATEGRVRDIGPPGRWVCPTCGFQLTKAILRPSDGAVGVDASPVEDICQNDGSSLRQVTWKEDAEDANRVGLESMKRADLLRTALVGLVGVDSRAELEQLEAAMRLMPAPAQDKAATIDAIHALLATGAREE